MGVAPFFGIHTCSTQTLAPSGAHAPVCPQEKGASKKTGCDTHWVPDIGTQWRASSCFLCFKMCVSQNTHWVPDIGTQWRACTCGFPKKRCVRKNWVWHPLGTRHWHPVARVHLFLWFYNVCIAKKWCDTHSVPDIGTQWRACPCVSPKKGCIQNVVKKIQCRFMSHCCKCWNWLACDIVDKWFKHGHGENVSCWQIFEMWKISSKVSQAHKNLQITYQIKFK